MIASTRAFIACPAIGRRRREARRSRAAPMRRACATAMSNWRALPACGLIGQCYRSHWKSRC